MITPDDPTGIEELALVVQEAAAETPISVTDTIAALAQALGSVYEYAREHADENGTSEAELKELIDRYSRKGALISATVSKCDREARAMTERKNAN